MKDNESMTEKDKAMMKRAQIAMTTLREKFPDLFGNISMDTVTEYSCLATAVGRSEAAKQEGSICDDYLAGKICGEEGAALAELCSDISCFSGRAMKTHMSLRTYFADYTIKSRHPSIHQIVILGSGMDTRAFRMMEVADCHVIEVDGSKLIQDFKQRRIDELKLPLLAKKRDVLVADLSHPSWQERLLALGFMPSEPTFWLVEGLLVYLTPEQNDVLLTSIDKLSAPHSEFFCDVSGGSTVIKHVTPSGERIRKYGEDNELLKALPWTNDVVFRRSKSMEYSGSLWDSTRFKDYIVADKGELDSCFFSWLKKDDEKNPL